jgi:hypothetical protein
MAVRGHEKAPPDQVTRDRPNGAETSAERLQGGSNHGLDCCVEFLKLSADGVLGLLAR